MQQVAAAARLAMAQTKVDKAAEAAEKKVIKAQLKAGAGGKGKGKRRGKGKKKQPAQEEELQEKLKPEDLRNQPEDMRNHPEDMRNQPEDMRNQPEDVRNQPEDVRNQPEEASIVAARILLEVCSAPCCYNSYNISCMMCIQG